MTPLVSIIITNYQCGQLLREAVESALAQRYPAIEVMVVDDGSTDGSADAIADLVADGRVNLITQPNAGVASARNTGVAASSGAYLVFLDCDDTLHPDMVARLVAHVDPADPLVFAYADYVHVDLAGTPLPEIKPLRAFRSILEGNLLAPLLVGPYMLLLSMLVSRKLVDAAGGFDPQYTAVDDYDLLLRISCAGGVARYCNEPLAFYRHRPGSQSADTAQMRERERTLLRDFTVRYADYIVAIMPQFLEEIRASSILVWKEGAAHLRTAEEYARSLEAALNAARGTTRLPVATLPVLTADAAAATEPLVSIIIAFDNDASYVRDAVESALAQTYSTIEVIVVDGGTLDGGVAAIADLVERGAVQVITSEDAGLVVARNAGLAASHGAYLVFLDSDDYLDPQMVERLVPLLDPADPRVFAYCDYQQVTIDREPLSGPYGVATMRTVREGNLLVPLLAGSYFQPNCVLISRALVVAADGFDPATQPCEDYDLWLRVSCIGGSARFLDMPLAFYRVPPEQLLTHTTRMAYATSIVLSGISERYPVQVAHVLRPVIDMVLQRYEQAWLDGNERLRDAETYAWSLEAAFREAEAYARTLEVALAARTTELAVATTYARSLEVAFGEAEAYARSLEVKRSAHALAQEGAP